jgi:hypothetical protein
LGQDNATARQRSVTIAAPIRSAGAHSRRRRHRVLTVATHPPSWALKSAGEANSRIADRNGWRFHIDGVHLNTVGGMIRTDVVQAFLGL